MEIHGQVLPPRRTEFERGGFVHSRWMKRMIEIDGSDDASFDRNDASKSQSFDRKWRLQMRPRRSCEVRCHLRPSSDLNRAATINRRSIDRTRSQPL